MQNDQSSPHCALVLLWLIGFDLISPSFFLRDPSPLAVWGVMLLIHSLLFFLLIYIKGRAV